MYNFSFTGSDNIPALKLVNDCYNGKATFVAGSVPASEHSVMCAGGKETEIETYRRMLKLYPSGVVSIVSDTWDFWNVITNIAVELKDDILSRVPDELGMAKVVFRPDSGDPVKIICGYKWIDTGTMYSWEMAAEDIEVVKMGGKYYLVDYEYGYDGDIQGYERGEELSEAEVKGAVECLAEIFGTTTNAKGFKTLNPRVGLIYGDSITIPRATDILEQLAAKGYASDNIVFGIGSYTFQYNTRDTFGFAMKATYVEVNGEKMPIFKDPKTDDGTKKSAKGLLKVEGINGDYRLRGNVSEAEEASGCLQTVYKNGVITKMQDFATMRERVKNAV